MRFTLGISLELGMPKDVSDYFITNVENLSGAAYIFLS